MTAKNNTELQTPNEALKSSGDVFLDFEKPIASLEKKLRDLKELGEQQGVDLKKEIQALEDKVSTLIEETFSHLSPWQRVQLSRHPNRPYARDYIAVSYTHLTLPTSG